MIPPGLAVVTGATAGIGREFCRQLAARGNDLLAVARDAGRLEQLGLELRERHTVEVEAFRADLSTAEDLARLESRLAGAERLSLLVNNAGFGTRGALVETDPDQQSAMLRLHTLAPMRLTAAALPPLLHRGSGGVINVSSVAAFIYSAGNVNYCATKAYLNTFTEGVDAELRGTGVRAQALCPGFTRTEFHQRMQVGTEEIPRWAWMSAETVVRTSLRSLDRAGSATICIPGLGYRLLVGLIRLTPRRLLGSATALRRARV